ncbi:MAG: TolC family protein, partial [Limisphaerales bacterium]
PAVWPVKECDLEFLTLAAFYFHPDLELARARIQIAKASAITAGERPNPAVSFTPEYALNAGPNVSPWILGFNFDLPIETAGKRRHRISRATNLIAVAKLSLGETAWKIRSQLRGALVEFMFAQRAVELFQREKEIRKNFVERLEQRFANGDASRTEVYFARTELLNFQLAFRAAEGRVIESKTAVASAIGLSASALDEIKFVWPELNSPVSAEKISVSSVQSAGLLNRLDIRRSLVEYAAAESALRIEIAKQYPDVHLTPGYQFDQGTHKFSLGPSVTLPIFNHNQGGVADANAKRQEAAAQFLALQGQVISQTEKAFAQFQNAVAQFAEADSLSTELQKRAEKSAQRAREIGETDRAALASVQVQSSILARARLDALLKVQTALGALEDAAQRPLTEGKNFFIPNLEKQNRE